MFLFGAVFYMRDGDYRSCVYLQEYKRNFADKRLKCRAKPWLYGDWMGGARSGFTPELCGSRRRAKGTLCASPSVYDANSGSGGLRSSGTGRGYVDEISHKPPYINAVSVADPVSDIFAGINGQMATAYNRKSVHIGIFERTIDRYRNEMKMGMPFSSDRKYQKSGNCSGIYRNIV